MPVVVGLEMRSVKLELSSLGLWRMKYLCTVVLMLILRLSCQAQVVVEFRGYESVDCPNVVALFAVSKGGEPVADLKKENVMIMDMKYPYMAHAVEAVDTPGVWRIRWYMEHAFITSLPTGSYPNPRIVVTLGEDVAIVDFPNSVVASTSATYVRWGARELRFDKILDIGAMPVGKDTSFLIRLKNMDPKYGADSVIIDSIAITGDAFSIQWRRAWPRYDTLPAVVYRQAFADVAVRYRSDGIFRSERLSFYYRDGTVQSVTIRVNLSDLPVRTEIQLLEPLPGRPLTPCQPVMIRWKGSSGSSPVFVEYSADGGGGWQEIGQSMSDSLLWVVPDTVHPGLLIRVRQNISGTEYSRLPMEKIGSLARTAVFSRDGSLVATASDNTSVGIWRRDGTLLQVHSVRDFVLQPTGLSLIGLEARSDDEWVSLWASGGDRAVLVVHSAQGGEPLQYRELPRRPVGMNILAGGVIAFSYADSPRLSLYDSALVLREEVLAMKPVKALASAALSDTLTAILLSGEIVSYPIDNVGAFASIMPEDFPLVSLGARSPVGGYVGIVSGPGGITAVVDISTGSFVRLRRNMPSNQQILTCAFSGSGKYLGFGSAWIPQVSLWNVTNNAYAGQGGNHDSVLLSLRFAPTGDLLATCGASIGDNVRLTKFTFPEVVVIAAPLPVVPAVVDTTPVGMPSTILGDTVSAFVEIRNLTPDAGMAVDSAWMLRGESYFLAPRDMPLVLEQREVVPLKVYFAPRDTGMVRDTVVVRSCSREFFIPVEGFAANRKLTLLADGYSFGELCTGLSTGATVMFVRNDDSTSAHLQRIAVSGALPSPFAAEADVLPVTLAPGEVLPVRLSFTPLVPGPVERSVEIYHSYQSNVVPGSRVSGIGLGISTQLSASSFMVVPETGDMLLTVSNTSAERGVLESYSFASGGGYEVVDPPLPVEIYPGDSVVLKIRSSGVPANARMMLQITPCVSDRVVSFTAYSGSLAIQLPSVKADPRGRAALPVQLDYYTATPWEQPRDFFFSLSMNPRLYLPDSAWCSWGEAEIVSMVIDPVADRRITTIRVRGVMPRGKSSFSVYGTVGLAEVINGPITLSGLPQSVFSSALSVTVRPGSLTLDVEDPRRRLVQPSSLWVVSVGPSPASDLVDVVIASESSCEADYFLTNVAGVVPLRGSVYLRSGPTVLPLSVKDLPAGVWTLVVRTPGAVARSSIVVSR